MSISPLPFQLPFDYLTGSITGGLSPIVHHAYDSRDVVFVVLSMNTLRGLERLRKEQLVF